MTPKKSHILILFFTFLLIACPIPPDLPPIPDPVLHPVEMCMDSGAMKNTYCPEDRIEVQHFLEADLPTEHCDFHVKPIPQFDMNLSWQQTGRFYSPLFCKGGLFLKELPHYTTAGFKQMIDEVAENNYANVIRMMLWWWDNNHSVNDNEVDMAHPKVDGKYDLHQINMVWWNKVKERIAYCAERNITVALVINNQSMIRSWDWGWLHQDNNTGWNGVPTYYDHYGWTKWVHLSDPNFGTPDERLWYAATRDYLLWMYDFILTELAPYKDFLIIDNNEIDAGAIWHDAFANICEQYGYYKNQRITSVRHDALDWILTKPSIRNRWNIQIHGIFVMDDYLEKRDYLAGIQFNPCGDGGGEAWWTHAGPEGVADILWQSLQDGNTGFIGNTEGLDWGNMDYAVAIAMRDMFIKWINR